MTTFPINRPKFFNIILQQEANNLIIPTEFTSKHGRELTDHVFLNVPNGKLWKVELVKSDDEILFDKGWENFRDNYSVEFGCFLVFVYDGDSRFTVFMFSRTCSEISFSDNWPKFFKVILEPEANSLIIPTEFTVKHGHELADRVFLNVPSGKSWEIELVKSDDGILLEKGWEDFRDHYSVEFGYFLVFVYDGDSRFTVFMFNRTCTEIEYPFDNNNEEAGSESDDSAAILDENWESETKKSSIKGQEGSDGSLKTREVDEELADEMTLDGTGEVTESNTGKENFANQEGGSSHTKKSFTFHKELTVSTAHRLSIDKKFVDDTGIRSPSRMTLQNTEGKEWDVNLVGKRHRRSGLAFCGGWNKFLIDNKIIVGSTILFEFISSSKIQARVVKTGPNEKDLFSNVVKERGKYMIAASHDGAHSKRANVSRTIKPGNNDEQIKEKENGFLVGSKSGMSHKMEKTREKCTEREDRFHDNDEEAGSESDASDYIVDENCKTKKGKGKRLAVVPPQEANDESLGKKLKTKESAEKMKVDDGKVTESDKYIITDNGSTLIIKQLMMSSAYKLEIPRKFEECNGLKVHEQITLQNMEGEEWPVETVGKTSTNTQLALCSGWKKFLDDNNVTVGSRFSLKFISTSKFQAQVIEPGPDKNKLLGYVRRRGGRYVIITPGDLVNVPRAKKSENHDRYQTKEGEENDDYQTKEEVNDDYQTEKGEHSSGAGSKLNVAHIMKTRCQVELDLLSKYAKKIQNSDNGRNKTGREKKADSYGVKRLKL